jgi:hypothetical protein
VLAALAIFGWAVFKVWARAARKAAVHLDEVFGTFRASHAPRLARPRRYLVRESVFEASLYALDMSWELRAPFRCEGF